MLWTITVILLVLWVLGLVSGSTMGAWVHILLVLAIVSLIFAVLRRGGATVWRPFRGAWAGWSGGLARGRLFSSARCSPLGGAQAGELLLHRQERREEIAPLFDAAKDGIRLEREEGGVARLEAAAHLLPGDRRGDGGALAGAQRVGADGGLVGIVLAPVHQDLAAPQRLLHVGDHQPRLLRRERFRHRARERLGLLVGGAGVQRQVELDALGARG